MKFAPHTIEIELTNYCNADCVFCNARSSKREKGFLSLDLLTDFIDKISGELKESYFYKLTNGVYPKIVFAGLGEPTLHPSVLQAISICKKRGYNVQLVTNGYNLSEGMIKGFIENHLDEIAISLHSLNHTILHNITKLDPLTVIKNTKIAIKELYDTNISIELWRILPPPGMQQESEADKLNFEKWISAYPKVHVLGPSNAWSRDGKVENSLCEKVNDGNIWCNKIAFTYNIAYDGQIVICCNDYNRISVKMGNVVDNSYYDTIKLRKEILMNEYKPEICLNCKRWSDKVYENILKKWGVNGL